MQVAVTSTNTCGPALLLDDNDAAEGGGRSIKAASADALVQSLVVSTDQRLPPGVDTEHPEAMLYASPNFIGTGDLVRTLAHMFERTGGDQAHQLRVLNVLKKLSGTPLLLSMVVDDADALVDYRRLVDQLVGSPLHWHAASVIEKIEVYMKVAGLRAVFLAICFSISLDFRV
eukprot:TRINITY_DN25645_c0_g1_i1.p1 TRINITY_DN25645_c0_g1~~TRINITY_DN25645_c0_g1_i1.p1  ORF type:complete len:173 (+),score=67.25 TRINITY_DN25645_c0_g1_i1:47-565(+)